jgi:hypothetical protein
MKRSKEISTIIEGFKLGKLGAGKKKFAQEPEKDFSVVRQRRPFEQLTRSTWIDDKKVPMSQWRGGVQWIESSGFKFFMYAQEDSEDRFPIYVVAGPDLKVTFHKGYPDYNKAVGAVYRLSSSEKKDAKAILTRFFDEIKNSGSFGYALATGKLEKGWRVNPFLTQYLFDVAGIKTSPYFEFGF